LHLSDLCLDARELLAYIAARPRKALKLRQLLIQRRDLICKGLRVNCRRCLVSRQFRYSAIGGQCGDAALFRAFIGLDLRF